MERPGLKQLLADVRAGKVHVVVVYKVDRLTRSLADFAKIVEILDTADASFVSVTQAFNTTTSMGRLTLNVLLSFAQFEREVSLSGWRELGDALGELKKSTERAVLRRTAVKALTPFVERAKQLVPVHEGHLRDSIVIGTTLNSSAKAVERAEPKGGVRVFAGTANRNGVPREFGSERSPAHPFMRPAWDQTSAGMLDQIRTDLSTDIEATAARAARKAAKQT